jgi:putative ABC transport system permease protein
VHFLNLLYFSFPVHIVVLMTFAFIYNTFQMSVVERTRHIGLLRSLGATKQQVRQMIFYEIQWVSMVGIPIGLLLGVYGLRLVAFIYRLCFESGSYSILHVNFTFSPLVILFSVIVSGIAIYCSAWLPARQAVHIAPMNGLRAVDQGMRVRRPAPNRLSDVCRRLLGIDNMLVLRSMRTSRKKFYMNIFSLTLSVFLFTIFTYLSSAVILGNMGSTKQTADFTVRNELHSIRFISDVTQALEGMKGVGTIDVKDMDHSAHILLQPIVKEEDPPHEEIQVDGKAYTDYRGRLSLFREENIPYYAAHVLEGKVQDIQEDVTHVIAVIGFNESYPKIKVGDEGYLSARQELESKSSIPGHDVVKIKIAAVVRGNQPGNLTSIIVQPDMYERLTAQEGALLVPIGMDIYLQDAGQEHTVYQVLKQKLESRYGYVVDSKVNSEKDFSLGGLQISIMLYGFVIAIVIIASLNIVNTLVMNLWMRQKEFSLFRAMGLSQRRLQSMIVKEGLFYGMISGGLGGLCSYGLLSLIYFSTGRSLDMWIWMMILAPICMVTGIGYVAARIAISSMKAKPNFQGRVYD